MAQIKHIHVLRQVGTNDLVFSFQTRTADTDAIFQWDGDSWVEIYELPGTDLIYDTCSFMGRMYWADGKNPISVIKPDEDEVCEVAEGDGPVVQYLVGYQERIVGAGDARTQAEVEADGGVWPADSNRNRVLFSEVIDDTQWSPNNFINVEDDSGEVISGLGVNSITSATRGAQAQLVVFKPHSTMINDGTLGAAEQRMSHVSRVIGCPGYHSIVNTPFGLVFCSAETVCLLDTTGKEPNQIGFVIAPAITEIPASRQKWTAAIFHDQTYKLSITPTNQTTNQNEWWLDMRPQVFPEQQNWYGPHTGDLIFQYVIIDTVLAGSQDVTTTMWQLDVEGTFRSMSSSSARSSVMTWPRVRQEEMQLGKLDAFGYAGFCSTSVAITEAVDFDYGTANTSATFTTPSSLSASLPSYNVTRPLKRPAHDVQVSITHSANSDMEVHSVFVRAKLHRRQSEKQLNSTQT